MEKDFDCCALINDIEKDPRKIRKGLKAKHIFILRAHLEQCESCNKKVDKILSQNKRKPDNFTNN